MILRNKCVYGITLVVLSVGLLGLLVGCLTNQPDWAPYEDAASRPKGKAIFEIGQEDRSRSELLGHGFEGQPEYTCSAGVDCSSETFPKRMHIRKQPYIYEEDISVACVTIVFDLMRNYKELVLRISRAGSETTAVTVNGTQTYLVSSEMLGSGDGGRYGVYNLSLGAMEKGTHKIELTIQDDGKGNGSFGWDALVLIAKKR